MKITLLPTTTPGKWSIWLVLGVFVCFFVLRRIGLILGRGSGNETFFSNLYAAIPALLAWLSGAGAFISGLLGIIMNKERSVLVLLAILFGLFVLLFGLGEILVPH
jgi:hypothetical protein